MATITVNADKYSWSDNCLEAAAVDAASRLELDGYDLCPRWLTNDRDIIAMTVPDYVVHDTKFSMYNVI